MRQWIIYFLIGHFALPQIWAVSLTKAGVVRVGAGAVGAERAADQLVEARLRRWLENGSDPVSVKTLRGALGERVLQEARQLDTIQRAVAKLWDSLVREDAQEAERNATVLAGMWEGQLPLSGGKWLQHGDLALAAYHWFGGREGQAEKFVLRGIERNPLGGVEELPWELDLGGKRPAFEAKVKMLQTSVKRQCRLTIEGAANRYLTVNGYPVSQFSFPVIPMATYLLEVSDGNGKAGRLEARCGRPGKLTVALVPSTSGEDAPSLSHWLSAGGVEALYLFERASSRYSFFRFTAQGLESLAVSAPFTVSSVLAAPEESAMPFMGQSRAGGGALTESHRESLPSAVIEEEVSSPRWYNSPTFWLIAGGVVGTVTVSYFLSRSGPVKSQPLISIKID